MNITEKRKIEQLVTRQVETARDKLLAKFEQDVDAIPVTPPDEFIKLCTDAKKARAKAEEWSKKASAAEAVVRHRTPDDIVVHSGGWGYGTYTFGSRERNDILSSIRGFRSKKNKNYREDMVQIFLTSEYAIARQYAADDKKLTDFLASKLVTSIYLSGDSTALKLLDKMEKALTKIVAGF